PASRWFLARDKNKYGPYTWQQLAALAKRGDVRTGDMVLQEGTRQWVRADTLPGLLTKAHVSPSPRAPPLPVANKRRAKTPWALVAAACPLFCVLPAICGIVGFLYFPSS